MPLLWDTELQPESTVLFGSAGSSNLATFLLPLEKEKLIHHSFSFNWIIGEHCYCYLMFLWLIALLTLISWTTDEVVLQIPAGLLIPCWRRRRTVHMDWSPRKDCVCVCMPTLVCTVTRPQNHSPFWASSSQWVRQIVGT